MTTIKRTIHGHVTYDYRIFFRVDSGNELSATMSSCSRSYILRDVCRVHWVATGDSAVGIVFAFCERRQNYPHSVQCTDDLSSATEPKKPLVRYAWRQHLSETREDDEQDGLPGYLWDALLRLPPTKRIRNRSRTSRCLPRKDRVVSCWACIALIITADSSVALSFVICVLIFDSLSSAHLAAQSRWTARIMSSPHAQAVYPNQPMKVESGSPMA